MFMKIKAARYLMSLTNVIFLIKNHFIYLDNVLLGNILTTTSPPSGGEKFRWREMFTSENAFDVQRTVAVG